MNDSEYVICLRGLRFFGYHGVLPEEGRRGQFFLVDLDLTCTPLPADDDIAAAVDYSAVYDVVKDIVTGEPAQLIETLLLRIGRAVLDGFPRVVQARVAVRKPEAPLPGPFQQVAVSKTFSRRESRPYLAGTVSPGFATGQESGDGPPGTVAYLGLGSNLGDRLSMLRCALAALAEQGLDITAASPVYETEPWGVTEQPSFLNAVAEVRTRLGPRSLLAACKEVEAFCGRTPSRRWGPRAVDVDILLYGDEEVRHSEPDLHIPHRHLTERAFALVPLADINPRLVLPDGRPLGPLAAAIDSRGMRLVSSSGWAEEFTGAGSAGGRG